RWHNAIFGRQVWSCPAPMVFQAEEDPAIPARAGDGAGYRRQALVGSTLPLKAIGQHGNGVIDTLPLADQPCAGDRAVIGTFATYHEIAAVELLAQSFQPLDGLRLKPAIGELLDAIG